VLYEAPHRLLASLADVAAVLGDRPLVVARELTKLHEEIWRGTASEARAYFGEGQVRGEITLVIAGASEAETRWDEAAVRAAMDAQLARGLRRKRAAAIVAEQSGWRKRDVYDLSLQEE
jgi:16S rRNA (cytidine1402-2'-O)-methyltransferase